MVSQRSVLISAIVVVSLLAFPIGTATAQECTLEPSELDPLVDVYNQNVDQAPGIVQGQLSDQRIDVRVDSADDTRRFAVRTTPDGRITRFDETAAEDPTVRVETDESTACGIITSEDPAAEFNQAYRDDSIEVTGVGVTNRVKIGAVKVGVRVGESLGLL